MLLKDATLATLDPPTVERGDLRTDGAFVVERGRSLPSLPGEEVVDLEGGLVIPGLVNAHTHLYSALARGMPGPASPPRSFLEILERVWWRLDRALDHETIRLSGLVGAVEAARSGTTLLFDHHSSPSCIRGSLDTLRQAIEEVGLRAALCYEVTDRNGADGREEGLGENRAFLDAEKRPLVRGLVGAHASFTLLEDSLTHLSSLVEASGAPLHVHVAEDMADVRDCRDRGHSSLGARFEAHRLVGPGAVLAHGVHLTPREAEAFQARGAFFAHCPRSNMNNGVGHAPTAAFWRAALGTDGLDEDLFAEARAAFLAMRDAGRPDALDAAVKMLAGGFELARERFGLPFGTLAPGAPADLVLLDYRPPTPLDSGSLAGHLLFGIDRGHVHSVVVAGRFVLRDRRVVAVDETALLAEARGAAGRLWRRMEAQVQFGRY